VHDFLGSGPVNFFSVSAAVHAVGLGPSLKGKKERRRNNRTAFPFYFKMALPIEHFHFENALLAEKGTAPRQRRQH